VRGAQESIHEHSAGRHSLPSASATFDRRIAKGPKTGRIFRWRRRHCFRLADGRRERCHTRLRAGPFEGARLGIPDTVEGILSAGAAGVSVLWANTILFEGYPLETAMVDFDIVGQLPAVMQEFDDKFETNLLLAEAGLPVARSFLLSATAKENACALADVEDACITRGMSFPMIVKPVRGRGSQVLTLVESLYALRGAATALIAAATFGDMLMVKEFLAGDEMTVTLMPSASPRPDGSRAQTHWAMPPVYRFDQCGGVAPYNGDVQVTANSIAITPERLLDPGIVAMIDSCVSAAALVDARTTIRIDCRADRDGTSRLFDLNMKLNMTGPGRPGREDQDCLSAIAARANGWSYVDLLQAMLAVKWRLEPLKGAS
jgi:hypothetical protein